MGRSRSPRGRGPGRGSSSDWISRQVANFGRHPQKRPRGLNVDQNGRMLLEQLMATWAWSQGLKEPEILGAVRENMFHEDGQLRFAIDADNQGRTQIRVLPKRDKWNRGSSQGTPAYKGGHQRAAWGGRPTPDKPALRGSVAKAVPKVGATPTPVLNTAKKLDMSLDELNQVEREQEMAVPEFSPPPRGEQALPAYHQKREDLRRSLDQMGLTASSSHVRLPARGRERGKGGAAWSRNSGGKGRSPRERPRSESPPFRGRTREDISRSPSPGDEDEMLAESAARSLNVDDGKRREGSRKPPPPPGDHWTKYADDGTVWYYYNGPLGEWWSTENNDVQPYNDEED